MDLAKLEHDVQGTLDNLETFKENVLRARLAEMQECLDVVFETTCLMMEIAEKYGLDVFTTLPYDG